LVPVDVFGVKRIGIDKWQKNFFWPVSDAQYFALCDQVDDVFREILEKSTVPTQDILISCSGLMHEYASFLHAMLVIKRLKTRELEIVYDDRSEFYWGLLNAQLPEHRIIIPSARDILKNRIKQTIKFFVLNCFFPNNVLSTFKSKELIVSLGTYSDLKRSYCKSHSLLVSHESDIDYLPGMARMDARSVFVPELEKAMECIWEGLYLIGRGWAIDFDDFSMEYMKMIGKAEIYRLYKIYQGILGLSYRKVDMLLVSEVAKPVHKVVSFALKRKFGTRIVGFEHGNTFGNLLSRYLSINELAHCDEYVVSTSSSIANFKASQSISKFPFGVSTSISAENINYYQNLWKKNGLSRQPERISRIMLIGFPMNQSRYTEVPGHFSLVHLDLELRIARFLKSRGYSVTYKVHPDRLEEAQGLFEGIVDEIEPKPFEKVYQECDAYVFGHSDSSTFGIALCTNRPIISIEIEGKKWNPRPYELIARRCRLVPAHIDSRNRVIYDESQLVKHIEEKVRPVNSEIIEQYMLPS
jgi:hypothetical protein